MHDADDGVSRRASNVFVFFFVFFWTVLLGFPTAGSHFSPSSRTKSIWCRSAQSHRERRHQDCPPGEREEKLPLLTCYKAIIPVPAEEEGL